MDKETSKCSYCGQPSDGAMLTMGHQMAHVPCVIRKLNELLDPDYDGTGKPARVISVLTGYVKLADDQSMPSSGLVVLLDPEPFEKGFYLGQRGMIEAG